MGMFEKAYRRRLRELLIAHPRPFVVQRILRTIEKVLLLWIHNHERQRKETTGSVFQLARNIFGTLFLGVSVMVEEAGRAAIVIIRVVKFIERQVVNFYGFQQLRIEGYRFFAFLAIFNLLDIVRRL